MKRHEFGITNIEYTEFERLGINDVAIGGNSKQSCFPANTNVLFIKLSAIEKIIREAIETRSQAILPGNFY